MKEVPHPTQPGWKIRTDEPRDEFDAEVKITDSSNVISAEDSDTDPYGIVPTGWVNPGQYKVIGFIPAPAGKGVSRAMACVKYKGCTGRYSTTQSYVRILKDYLATVE